jgi:hypothetical protein
MDRQSHDDESRRHAEVTEDVGHDPEKWLARCPAAHIHMGVPLKQFEHVTDRKASVITPELKWLRPVPHSSEWFWPAF